MEFENAARAARRAAKRARRDAEKSEKGKGTGDAAIRAQFAMMNAARPNIGGFAALGANFNANAGDRFAEADALRPNYTAPAVGFDGYPRAPQQQRDGGNAGEGAARNTEFQVEAESYRQNGRGDIEVQLKGGVITIPNQGIGSLRGRTGRR